MIQSVILVIQIKWLIFICHVHIKVILNVIIVNVRRMNFVVNYVIVQHKIVNKKLKVVHVLEFVMVMIVCVLDIKLNVTH